MAAAAESTKDAKEITRYAISTGSLSIVSILAAVALIGGLFKFSAEVTALKENQKNLEKKVELLNSFMKENIKGAKEALSNEDKHIREVSDIKIANLDRIQMMNNKHTREVLEKDITATIRADRKSYK